MPLMAIVVLASGCGSSSGGSSGSSAASPSSGAATAYASLTPVTIDFTFTWKAEYAPLVYADAKGLFAKQGISVTFREGTGSQAVYAGLGAGDNTFVVGPSGTAAQAASSGVPVINVATFIPVTPSVLVAQQGVTLKTPKDLEGKQVGLRTGADASLFIKAFLTKNAVDASQVHITNLNGAAANADFLTGGIQVVDAFTNNELPLLQAKVGAPLKTLSFADFGFPILGEGVSVSTQFMKSKPDLIKRFLAAQTAGIKAAKKNPNDAAMTIKQLHSVALPAQDIVNAQTQATLDSMTAPAGHPLGYASNADWDKMLTIFAETGSIKNRLPASSYYTNSLLPAS
ncbi:MAG: ABC transporter substrate-binding protein [Candidatus Dormibacteria bacterium]